MFLLWIYIKFATYLTKLHSKLASPCVHFYPSEFAAQDSFGQGIDKPFAILGLIVVRASVPFL